MVELMLDMYKVRPGSSKALKAGLSGLVQIWACMPAEKKYPWSKVMLVVQINNEMGGFMKLTKAVNFAHKDPLQIDS